MKNLKCHQIAAGTLEGFSSCSFQDGPTPFSPDMITSHFLHAYIVVRPLAEGDKYMVSVTARGDVPYFGPSIPSPAVFTRGSRLKEFILTKLINAQMASLKAEEFSKLELRTRTTLLNNLEEELSNKTQEFIGGDAVPPTVTKFERTSLKSNELVKRDSLP